MTLQWTAVALFLYVEIGLNLILCVPFVSAKRCASLGHSLGLGGGGGRVSGGEAHFQSASCFRPVEMFRFTI